VKLQIGYTLRKRLKKEQFLHLGLPKIYGFGLVGFSRVLKGLQVEFLGFFGAKKRVPLTPRSLL
jgi:hypothetical protein